MNISYRDRLLPHEIEIIKKYTETYPVKVGQLANELGLKVTKAPLPPRISGLIRPSDDARAGFEIKINKYESPERQRFTVAHELGHYLLHREHIGNGLIDNLMYRSGLTSRKEAEANRIAADIIMPARAVAEELRKLGGVRDEDAANKLALLFRVSPAAMRVRLGVS